MLVDGQWGSWSEWSKCSVTCGLGITKRNRTCNNPKPSNKGYYCVGDDAENQQCPQQDDVKLCPGKYLK